MNPVSAVALLEAPLYVALGIYVVSCNPRARQNLVMGVLAAVFAGWLVCFALTVAAPTKAAAMLWFRLGAVGWTFGPVLVWHFLGELTEARAVRASPWILVGAYGLAAIFLARQWTGTLFASDLVLGRWGWEEVASIAAPWSVAIAVHDICFPTVGLYWVWRWGRTSDRRRVARQARVILVTGIPALSLTMLIDVGLRWLDVRGLPGIGPLVLPLWAVGIVYAIARYRLLVLSPELAADRIIRTMVDGLVLLSPHDRIVAANPAAVALLAKPEAELLGRPIREVLADEPSTKRRERLASGAGYAHEILYRVAGKDPLHLRITAVLVLDDTEDLMGTVLMLRDVSARREMTRVLEARERHFRALIENASDLIVIIGRDGACRYASPSAERILGHPPSSLLGAAFDTHVHPDDAAKLRTDILDSSLGSDRPRFELRCQHADGSWRVLEVVATELHDGPTPGVLLNARDVTARLAMQEQLARADRERMETQLTQANRLGSVGLLAAGVAHEINNPLTYVVGNLEFLADSLKSMAAPERGSGLAGCVESALRGAWRIERIVRDLRSFARGGPEQPTRVDINKVVESALELATNQIKYRAKVVVELASVPPVRADQGRLGQVILNLVVNASQAIVEGNPDENTITVRSAARDGEVVLEIEDTGRGIEPVNLAQIFEPFFTTKAATEGSGLGLWVVRNIVESYGGKVEVRSEVGRGTTFVVRLPANGEERRPLTSSPPAKEAGAEMLGRARVLAIDDESELLDVVGRMLGDLHEVELVRSGVEAQGILEHDQEFDLVLCDLMMPELSGQELHAWVHRRWPSLAKRFVFMTGGALTRDSGEFVLGMTNVFLPKPLDWAYVRRLATEAVRRD